MRLLADLAKQLRDALRGDRRPSPTRTDRTGALDISERSQRQGTSTFPFRALAAWHAGPLMSRRVPGGGTQPIGRASAGAAGECSVGLLAGEAGGMLEPCLSASLQRQVT
jgi:hypothetical protein